MRIMLLACSDCREEFGLTTQEQKFLKSIGMPCPQRCPECRARRRLIFRSDRGLYHRPCSCCGEPCIACYAPWIMLPIFCNACWWSDKWRAEDYGRNYQLGAPFALQFTPLFQTVPKCALYNFDHENSSYCNFACHNKNCYMLFGSWFAESCYHGASVFESSYCVDSLFCGRNNWCYEVTQCMDCTETCYALNSDNCYDCRFIFDCRNCKHCYCCFNLRNADYHIFNKPVSPKEFQALRKTIDGFRNKTAETAAVFAKYVRGNAVHRWMVGRLHDNASGNYIENSRNIHRSFFIGDGEDLIHTVRSYKGQKNSMDIFGVSAGELIYNSSNLDFSFNCACCFGGEHNNDCAYCMECFHCADCFGCIGLRHKQHYIFNKQYAPDAYRVLRRQIAAEMLARGEWGEFFPPEASPYLYNETAAHEYYPLAEEQARCRGFGWQSPDARDYSEQTCELPDSIADAGDKLCSAVMRCTSCTRNYRLALAELSFYRRMTIPVPEHCPECRHAARMKLLNPVLVWERCCANCASPIVSSYAPSRPERVFCEQCYLNHLG